MGTSAESQGTGANTPYVPSWVNDRNDAPLPGAHDKEEADFNAQTHTGKHLSAPPRPPMPVSAPDRRFKDMSRNFSAFVRSGGNDLSALNSALRHFVHNGTGGFKNAVSRMGSSRVTARRVLGIFMGMQRDGTRKALKKLNQQHLTGKSLQDILLGVTEIVCLNGDTADQAIAREAWLETIVVFRKRHTDEIDELTLEQVMEIFLDFIAHSIEALVYLEVGAKGYKIVKNTRTLNSINAKLRSYIKRGVSKSFDGDLSGLSEFTDQRIRSIVDKAYLDAWQLLSNHGGKKQ